MRITNNSHSQCGAGVSCANSLARAEKGSNRTAGRRRVQRLGQWWVNAMMDSRSACRSSQLPSPYGASPRLNVSMSGYAFAIVRNRREYMARWGLKTPPKSVA